MNSKQKSARHLDRGLNEIDKALANSDEYEEELRELKKQGAKLFNKIYEDLQGDGSED